MRWEKAVSQTHWPQANHSVPAMISQNYIHCASPQEHIAEGSWSCLHLQVMCPQFYRFQRRILFLPSKITGGWQSNGSHAFCALPILYFLTHIFKAGASSHKAIWCGFHLQLWWEGVAKSRCTIPNMLPCGGISMVSPACKGCEPQNTNSCSWIICLLTMILLYLQARKCGLPGIQRSSCYTSSSHPFPPASLYPVQTEHLGTNQITPLQYHRTVAGRLIEYECLFCHEQKGKFSNIKSSELGSWTLNIFGSILQCVCI